MKLIKSKKFSKIKDIEHGFFNSVGGQSKNIYKSLNCGLGSKDKKSDIKKNLQIVRKKISKKAKNIFLLNQCHSNKFIYIDREYKFNHKKKPKADAIITNQKRLPIAILTADCAPILIYENKIKMIAAIHAGWKGAFKGIVNKVVKFMIMEIPMKKQHFPVYPSTRKGVSFEERRKQHTVLTRRERLYKTILNHEVVIPKRYIPENHEIDIERHEVDQDYGDMDSLGDDYE